MARAAVLTVIEGIASSGKIKTVLSNLVKAATSIAKLTFAQLCMPKIVTILKEGYSLVDLRADVMAGLTDGKPLAIGQAERSALVGKWHNVVIGANINRTDPKQSILNWWFDDRAIPRVISRPVEVGYKTFGNAPYFKIGPYRDQAIPGSGEVDKPWTFGFDEFKRDDALIKIALMPVVNPTISEDPSLCDDFLTGRL